MNVEKIEARAVKVATPLWIPSLSHAHPALLSHAPCSATSKSMNRVESVYTTSLALGTSLFLAWFCTRAKLTLLSSILQIRSSTFGSSSRYIHLSSVPRLVSLR